MILFAQNEVRLCLRVAQFGQSARLGTERSQVQILLRRPVFKGGVQMDDGKESKKKGGL